nr:hypothetical protein SHINE37_43682 [Rhizobiaceae bacterium]
MPPPLPRPILSPSTSSTTSASMPTGSPSGPGWSGSRRRRCARRRRGRTSPSPPMRSLSTRPSAATAWRSAASISLPPRLPKAPWCSSGRRASSPATAIISACRNSAPRRPKRSGCTTACSPAAPGRKAPALAGIRGVAYQEREIDGSGPEWARHHRIDTGNGAVRHDGAEARQIRLGCLRAFGRRAARSDRRDRAPGQRLPQSQPLARPLRLRSRRRDAADARLAPL